MPRRRKKVMRFFRSTKPMQDETVNPNATVEPEVVNEPEDAVEPAEAEGSEPAGAVEGSGEAEEQPAVDPEDRSAYNCPACGGEGLKDERTICPTCSGTGKV